MEKRFVIVHYNTPLLTECLVRSINLFVENAIIYIFDNSDKDPFIGNFDNVIIFDNTNGQIIDFDKWLEKYPNRFRSNGKSNKWGSAKHCYSVEKCMELIGENFILLDSDVLLKKDCSDLFDDKYIYCGEVITQPKSTVKRVLPFICFINVQLCKKYCVHYFDENHMHGLCYNIKNKYADRYDTGGGFYINSKKFTHKDIKYSDYIIHYGNGSWNKKGVIHQKKPAEWTNSNKKYWDNKMNKKVVYTCITGGYDGLIEPTYVTSGFDYVCFTDNRELTSSTWDIRILPDEVEKLSQVKKQRYIKINAHKVLNEYDLSIWVDGNVELRGDLNSLLEKTLKDNCSIYIPKHPQRNCIYDEADAVIVLKKDSKDIVMPQVDRYKGEGFPKNYGLLQSNIMIRKHNNNDCMRFMEAWFEELKHGSHRDQLSFNYVCWKNQDINVIYLDKKIYSSVWFNWMFKHKKVKPIVKSQLIIKPQLAVINEDEIIEPQEVITREVSSIDFQEKVGNVRKKIRLTTDSLYLY